MVTDDERREVAERLRGMHDYETAVPIIRACLGLKRGELMDDETRRRMSDRLADLIDPDCDKGRYEGVHTARPVDREALLSVARGLETFARSSGDGFEPVLSGGGCMRLALRIREACGEAVG